MNNLYRNALPAVSSGFAFDDEVLKAALKRIYNKDFNPLTDLEENLFNEFWDKLNEATEKGFSEVMPVDYDAEFVEQLRYNNAVFSAFKVHRAQNDMAAQLLDENGELKPFEQWLNDVQPIADHQVRQWFQTEYSQAVKRADMAANWRQWERDADVLPNLKWLKSTSITPGADHTIFWETVRPINDEFWTQHKPGDRWGCKCRLHNTDESATPTSEIPDGGNTDKPARGLESNPGKDAQIFSDSHPYNPPNCAACTLPGKRVISKDETFTNRLKGFFGANGKKDCYHCSKPVQLIKKSVEAREREDLETAMQVLIKKNLIRKVAPDKQIKITFKKSGNAHIVNDVLEKGVKLSKADLAKLNELIRESEYVRSSDLYKKRSDNILRFYYFKDKDRNVYYNVAEEAVRNKNGRIYLTRYAYSVTKNIPPKKAKNRKAAT